MYSFWILLTLALTSTLGDIVQEKKRSLNFNNSTNKVKFFSFQSDRKMKYALLLTGESENFMNVYTGHYSKSYGSGVRINTTMAIPTQIRIGYGDFSAKEGNFLLFDKYKIHYYPSGV